MPPWLHVGTRGTHAAHDAAARSRRSPPAAATACLRTHRRKRGHRRRAPLIAGGNARPMYAAPPPRPAPPAALDSPSATSLTRWRWCRQTNGKTASLPRLRCPWATMEGSSPPPSPCFVSPAPIPPPAVQGAASSSAEQHTRPCCRGRNHRLRGEAGLLRGRAGPPCAEGSTAARHSAAPPPRPPRECHERGAVRARQNNRAARLRARFWGRRRTAAAS